MAKIKKLKIKFRGFLSTSRDGHERGSIHRSHPALFHREFEGVVVKSSMLHVFIIIYSHSLIDFMPPCSRLCPLHS